MIDLEDAYTGAPRQITLQAPYVDGTGHIRTRERTLNVRIPKGVVQGQHIRLGGQGDPGGDSAEAGDLFLEVQFRPHGLYRVQGRDVHIDVPVAPWELALGAQVRVPTPAGKVEVTVPASSQSGDKLRLAGRGIPGKKSGDLYVVLRVIFPQADSEKGRQIYQDMKKEMLFQSSGTPGCVTRDIPQIMHNLASLLIPQEIFPQSGVITDTPLLRKFPCEIKYPARSLRRFMKCPG